MAGTQNQIGRKPSYGYIWMNTGNWTGVSKALTTSYQELTSLGTNFVLASTPQDFAMTTDGRLKYTGIPTKRFSVNASASFSAATFIELYKNGVSLNDSESYSAVYGRIPSFSVDLSANDYISIWAKVPSNTSVTFYTITLSAYSTERGS